MTQRSNWLQIGLVGKAHGLRGHFFISGRDDPLPETCRRVRIGDAPEEYAVEECVLRGQRFALKLVGVATREQVDELVGSALWMKRSELPVEEGEYLWEDLQGRGVVDVAGLAVGEVIEINNHGASDFVVIRDKGTRILRLPLIADYVDLDFPSKDEPLRLVVELNFFDELWDD